MSIDQQQTIGLERLERLRRHPRVRELKGMVALMVCEAEDACVVSERHRSRLEAWDLMRLLLEPSK